MVSHEISCPHPLRALKPCSRCWSVLTTLCTKERARCLQSYHDLTGRYLCPKNLTLAPAAYLSLPYCPRKRQWGQREDGFSILLSSAPTLYRRLYLYNTFNLWFCNSFEAHSSRHTSHSATYGTTVNHGSSTCDQNIPCTFHNLYLRNDLP